MIAKEFIIKELKRSPLYNNNKIVNQIIENANWKYKSLKPLLNPKEKNQFTWNSLYKMVEFKSLFLNLCKLFISVCTWLKYK